MSITSLLLPAQEVEPSSTAWLPVMPITSGELTLRPAGTLTHAAQCAHSCSCDVYAAAAGTVRGMTCLHCAVRDDDEPEHIWAEGIRLPPLLQACACSCQNVLAASTCTCCTLQTVVNLCMHTAGTHAWKCSAHHPAAAVPCHWRTLSHSPKLGRCTGVSATLSACHR
jgi:hypothetical protein